jgi:hypothetical protein
MRETCVGDLVYRPDGTTERAPDGHVCTIGRPFVARTEWGGMFRVMRLAVRLGDIPQPVRDQLSERGCGPWLENLNAQIELGEAVVVQQLPREVYGPRRFISLAELEGRVKALSLSRPRGPAEPAAPPSGT